MHPLLALLLLASAPAVLTLIGLLLGEWVNRRARETLAWSAGPWMERWLDQAAPGASVELAPADAPDGYWPATRTVVLSERTFAGRSPRDWAVAAHEVGHAQNLAAHPVLPYLLPGARLVGGLGYRAACCTAGVAIGFGQPDLLLLAWIALVLSCVGSLVTLLDEGWASARAWRRLQADVAVSAPAEREAVDAMGAAFGAYGLAAAGQVLVLAAWPLVESWVALSPATVPTEASHLGIWLVLVATPLVAVRIGLALRQAVLPEAVPTEFDLFVVLSRESRWESLAALGVVASTFALRGLLVGPLAAFAVALAATAAVGPALGAVGALVGHLLGIARRRLVPAGPSPRYRRRALDDVPQAMIAMFAEPPWYLRAMWLLPLAYLPLVALLLDRALG